MLQIKPPYEILFQAFQTVEKKNIRKFRLPSKGLFASDTTSKYIFTVLYVDLIQGYGVAYF